MNKTTIELTRIKRHWAGYALMEPPFSQELAQLLPLFLGGRYVYREKYDKMGALKRHLKEVS